MPSESTSKPPTPPAAFRSALLFPEDANLKAYATPDSPSENPLNQPRRDSPQPPPLALDDAAVDAVVHKSSFAKMKRDHETLMADYEKKTGTLTRRKGESQHFRKGKAGAWRDLFSPSDSAKFDHVYAVKMADSGLRHDFG